MQAKVIVYISHTNFETFQEIGSFAEDNNWDVSPEVIQEFVGNKLEDFEAIKCVYEDDERLLEEAIRKLHDFCKANGVSSFQPSVWVLGCTNWSY